MDATRDAHVFRVGQNRIHAPYMTVYLVISLQKYRILTIYTVRLRSLRKLINYLARKRKCLLIIGGLSVCVCVCVYCVPYLCGSIPVPKFHKY